MLLDLCHSLYPISAVFQKNFKQPLADALEWSSVLLVAVCSDDIGVLSLLALASSLGLDASAVVAEELPSTAVFGFPIFSAVSLLSELSVSVQIHYTKVGKKKLTIDQNM